MTEAYALYAPHEKNGVINIMKINEKLELIATYTSALEFIDRKTPLLEHSDIELEKQTRQLNKIKNKLRGVNFILAWIVVTVFCLIPMSILNTMIETDLNFLYITPIASIIILYLYKIKYIKNTQKSQIKAMEDAVNKLKEDNKTIIGEINYTKGIADEALTQLLLSQEHNREYDVLSCDAIYTNLDAINFAYGYINEPPNDTTKISPTFRASIEHFKAIIDDLKNNNPSNELLEDFKKAELRAIYRQGIIKRCEKLKNYT